MPRKKGQPYKIDITGQRFGRWLVLGRVAGSVWRCQCDCGTKKAVTGSSLKLGTSTSCGCYSRERTRKHGMDGTPTYNAWAHMLDRCNNPNHAQYADYGGRGITVCDEWREFVGFFRDMGVRPRGKSLDRIDNDGNYEPSNCRWATHRQQINNRRNTARVEYEGRLVPVSEIAARYKMSVRLLRERLKRGMSVEDAVDARRFNRWGATKARVR